MDIQTNKNFISVLTFLICYGVTAGQLTKVNFNPQFLGKKLEGHVIKSMPVNGLFMCLYECMVTAKCMSVNFYPPHATCELNSENYETSSESLVPYSGRVLYTEINIWPKTIAKTCKDVTCPLGQRCSSAPPSFVCLPDECDNLPEVAYATLTQDSTMRGLHARISYECGNGLIIRGDPSVTCKIGLKWSKVKFRCGMPSTCLELKQCSSSNSYTSDGEYWLYPPIFNSHADVTKIKVYCKGMDSDNPTEYITLSGTNNAHYNGREAVDYWEGPPSYCAVRSYGPLITTTFQKIRLNIEEMTIINNDFTYSSTSGGDPMKYGTGGDCTYAHGCLPRKGYFHVDTSNTGLIVSKSLKWVGTGWGPKLSEVTRNSDGSTITMTCGGKCGNCQPETDMPLEINPNEELEESAAIMPVCG